MANTAFGAAFDKALRAYQTGGITYSDFLSEIDAQMEGGASVSELLDVLWRREQIEPLSPPVHAAVLARIEQPLRQSIPEESKRPVDDVSAAAARAADELVFSWETDPILVSAGEQQELARLAATAAAAAAAEAVEAPKSADALKPVETRKPFETTPISVASKKIEAPQPTDLPKPVAVTPTAAAPGPDLPKAAETPKPVPTPAAAATKADEATRPEAPPVSKLADVPQPVAPRKPAEATAPVPIPAVAAPQSVAAPKPVEAPKSPAASIPAEARKPLETPASLAAPKHIEAPPVSKLADVAQPVAPPQAADASEAPKPAAPPAAIAATPAMTAPAPKPVAPAKPIESPKLVAKADDGSRRLGKAIARELHDWLSPLRPKPSQSSTSALSALPATPTPTPVPASETPRVSTSRAEPRTVVLDARAVPPPAPVPPSADPPRNLPFFKASRVSTSRAEPKPGLPDPRTLAKGLSVPPAAVPPVSLPPLAGPPRADTPPRTDAPRTDAPRVDVSVFETPRISSPRREPPTIVLNDATAPSVFTESRVDPPPEMSVFATPRVSTSRQEPPTIVLDDLTAAPVRVTRPSYSPAPSSSPPAGLEPLRVSTARSEAPTVVLGDRVAPPATPPAMPSTAEFFGGRFRLIEQVADSDMSRVYRAEDVMVPKAERRVIALKVFKRSVSGDPTATAAMQAEFARLRALSHPNIVALIECGSADGAPFVTMEWLTGMSLYRRLDALAARNEPRGLPAREARHVIGSVAAALEYVHARGAVHGDLKPGNVFLCSDGTVKLIDFGMSTWFAHGPFAASTPVVATPRYASPQVMARQPVTEADDVYAFACVVYEIMSGRYPFVGVGGVEDARFVPLRRPEFDTAQYAALLNGLAQDAAQRVPSVPEFMKQFSGGARARRTLFGTWAALALMVLGGGWVAYTGGAWRGAVALFKKSPVPATASVAAAPAFRDCRSCPLMVVVPAGRLTQDGHPIAFEHPFAMAAAPVTVGEYQAFVTATRRDVRGCDVYDGTWRRRLVASFKDPGFPQTADHPVTCVSWSDAVAYTEWLTQTTGHAYSLPSAAEWEYAARAGDTAATPWEAGGNACAVANVADHSAAARYKGWSVFACSDGFMYTSPANAFPANAFGLHDMLGNVLEWTLDCWQPNTAAAAPADGSARGGRDCRQHEVRGASWFSSPSAARIARREHFAASYRISTTGLRVVRQVDK